MQVDVRVAAALLGAVLILSGCTAARPSDLSLTNKSSQPITSVRILVGGEEFEQAALGIGETWKQGMTVHKEGGFVVTVAFRSGRTVRKELGYVTRGIGAHHELTVLDSDVLLQTTVQK